MYVESLYVDRGEDRVTHLSHVATSVSLTRSGSRLETCFRKRRKEEGTREEEKEKKKEVNDGGVLMRHR